ncbi:MAG: TIGR04282 family arsenosugar biosynthesis glycosyltransferase [Pseudomonas sp.]|nr:TIGR04282 family arsenosugar biosynthesis glycosyltransferase [Pseudomonas sp.]
MNSPLEKVCSKYIANTKGEHLSSKPVRIVICAKAPLPGLAKTRLISALGAQGAAHLARQLLVFSVEQALKANIGIVELCVTPSMQDPIWHRMALSKALQWSNQDEGDLGDRLARVAQRVLANGEAVLLMGTDCPGLTAECIAAAAHALSHYDSCLVPVSDGGYALLGLNQYLGSVFIDMPWSTAAVARLTRERLLAQGLRLHERAELHDIDEPEDLQYLPAQLRAASTTIDSKESLPHLSEQLGQ